MGIKKNNRYRVRKLEAVEKIIFVAALIMKSYQQKLVKGKTGHRLFFGQH
jgi:hypothetical protein